MHSAALSAAVSRLRVPAVLVAVWLLIGSAFIGGKVGVSSVPPFLFSGSRFAVARAILPAWGALRGGGRPAPRPADRPPPRPGGCGPAPSAHGRVAPAVPDLP